MSEKKSVYKPKSISGYPEWLPEARYVEQQWFDHIRRVFESYGFCNIETPSVEELDVITAKGEVDKEIYVLERLHQEDGEKKESRLALHFDQTVPLARYVAQHFGDLVFPFKRYQMQRVWRGERPQKGRFREFYQCDIDVIGVDQLGLHFDAEMPAIIYEVLSGLQGMENEKFQLRISNRKILIGVMEALEIENPEETLRSLDKMAKITPDGVRAELTGLGLNQNTITSLLTFADQKFEGVGAGLDLHNHITSFNFKNDLMLEGAEELHFVMDQLSHIPDAVADLSIVRGLDYYTGTVYETTFVGNEGYGSICSGGRYDDLASSYINKKLPGVGISIGFSRLFAYMLEQGKLPLTRKSPADILMALPPVRSDESLNDIKNKENEIRKRAQETAQILRKNNYKVEMFHMPQKIGKQIAYAEKKGIPYVWFPPFDEDGKHEVKNMAAQTQTETTPENWKPKTQPETQKGQINDAA